MANPRHPEPAGPLREAAPEVPEDVLAPWPQDPLVGRYLEHVRVEKRLAQRTVELYTLDLQKLQANAQVAGVTLTGVHNAHIRRWVVQMHGAGRSGRGIALILSGWRGFYTWLGRDIPHEFRKAIGNRIYGCDDCLAVCPWNKFAQPTSHEQLIGREDLNAPRLQALAALDDSSFRTMFSGSPIKRIGRNRFIRNVLIAIGNSRDSALRPSADALRSDPDPIVAEAAEWAVEQLSGLPGQPSL